MARKGIDKLTRQWIRGPADQAAAAAGCRFDLERGQFVVDWIQKYCRLYEGEHAGELMILHDWQLDCTLRLFGWVRWSERWNRWIRRFTQASVWVAKKNKKPMALDTRIPTPDGWAILEDLRVGDHVFDENGATCRVRQVHETLVGEPCYRVTLADGTSIVAGESHEWYVKRVTNKRRWGTYETGEMFRTQTSGDHHNYLLAIAGPLRCPSRQLPIDPYLLGAWLGNGCHCKGQIDVRDGDETTLSGISAQYPVTANWRNTGASRTYQLTGLVADLRKIGVFGNKRIPQQYLRASIDQRWALLQGLMDTDGCVGPKGQCIYVTVSDQIKDGVLELVRSLGLKATVNRRPSRCQTGPAADNWRILFTAHAGLPVSRLARKMCLLPPPPTRASRSLVNAIVSIEPVPSVPVRCITVDSPSHLFLAGDGMTPTHNSPTLSAWGLYLLAGDGEAGQKVYLAAKDGSQAREIAGKHAIEMLMQSPELMAECTINKNLMQITHEPTRSIMRPLSSSNSRTQESKEGLNGSVLIDETHVVDRAFVDRISRMGISRSEPLQIEVSTAGNNPDGYGKSRFDHAVQVLAGTIVDDGLFVEMHAAPQDLEPAELDKDPLKYGAMANPAMGHTVYPEEFLRDYQTSKAKGLSEFANFCMYRLNIWQKTNNPFLKASDWAACCEEFTEDDLAGRMCVAGLDLSQTQDMSALVLVFPDDDGEGAHVLPYFWLPEQVAKDKGHLVPFLEWQAAGLLTLTPGSVVDYGYIRSTFRDLAQRFTITKLGYDRMYAEETTQNLAEGASDAAGNVIEEGTGVERIAVPQTIMHLAGPTARFERMVIAGTLRHNNHPILSWQAGHVQVWRDKNNNKRPVKPSSHDVKKIDGIIATVMGLAVLGEESDAGPSVYETRGVVRIGS